MTNNKLPLGPLIITELFSNLTFTSLGIIIGFLPILDILFYQILNKTSPPIPNLLAVLLDNTPFDVEIIETPRPSRTLGISLHPTKTLLPGLLTRSIPVIADLPL